MEVERFQFSPDGQPGVIVRYTHQECQRVAQRELRFEFAVKTDLRPVWFSEQLGIIDAPDTVVWSSATDLVRRAGTPSNPWFCVWGATPSRGAQPIAHPPPIATRGAGVTAASSYSISLEPHGTPP